MEFLLLILGSRGYEILKGKYEIPGLPAFYAEDSAQADTLVISMKDRDGEILVKLYYGVFEEFDLITRAVCVENLGEEEVYLERALSCCVDQTCGNWDWMTFYGFPYANSSWHTVCGKFKRNLQSPV